MDSTGQKIARKLDENCCLQHMMSKKESMRGIAALVDSELAPINDELFRARNESHEAKQAWARAIERAEKAEAELARERDAMDKTQEFLDTLRNHGDDSIRLNARDCAARLRKLRG